MKKLVLLAVLALALPTAVFASSNIDYYVNFGGTLSGSNSGLQLSGSDLIAVGNGAGLITGNLGSVSFETGPLTSGSLKNGGTFAGGSLTITGNGTDGLPSGTLFSGTFSGPVFWTKIGTNVYALTGNLGTNDHTIQFTIDTGKGYFNGSGTVLFGYTDTVVPEPGSLSLLGMGLIGIGGIIRRKLMMA